MTPVPETSESTPSDSTPSPASFRTTQWTQVLAARGGSADAQAALSDLCAAYYTPVVAFLRRTGRDEDAARELAHAFFAHVLERRSLGGADPARGRFRSYLLGALKHFAADQQDRALTAKRGGGAPHEPLAAGTDTSPGLDVPDARAPEAEREFDRKWALTVLDRALTKLAEEHTAAEEGAKFAALKPWLTGDNERLSQADVAHALGMNEGAVKVALHRLRKRFRELVRAEITQTLADPAQVKEELQHLMEALG